jgi:ABC-type transport system substrate-binding protein
MQGSDELRSTYSAWRGNQAMAPERVVTSAISTAENRWSGLNKTGYSDPEHDRLFDRWTQALDRAERNDLMVQMYRGMNEGLPGLPLYYNFWVTAHTSDVEGPQGRAVYAIQSYGNIHQWRWVR